MEGLTRLVDDSMARHGFDAPVDHRRLQWSRWLRCETSFSLLLVPSAAGIYTLGEEIVGELPDGKRMLAVFRVSESDDLCFALRRELVAPSLRERLSSGRCFIRFVQVSDTAYRQAACKALQLWLATSAEAATGIVNDCASQPDPIAAPASRQTGSSVSASDSSPPPLPAGF
ncbi:MAG: hypothetical protein DMG82_28030 [Acidobacteria bacterium]|nr:MAG: hypothetical protein DMG82_28030 [Acidobacteriota bacterium]